MIQTKLEYEIRPQISSIKVPIGALLFWQKENTKKWCKKEKMIRSGGTVNNVCLRIDVPTGTTSVLTDI